MKVSIVLEKKSRFNIELSDIQATILYKKLVGIVVNAPTVGGRVQGCRNNENIDIPKEAPTISKVTAISEEYNYHKKLVMIKCPSCNGIATPVLQINNGEVVDKNITLSCRSCQEQLPIGEIKPARYQCPNCNTTASFYVSDDLNEVSCKTCGGLIDLIWHEKKEQYLSANLIK